MNYEQFLLIKLAEEASEVAQIALKAAQFGMGEKRPGQDLTNAERIYAELNDVNAIVEMMTECLIIDFNFKPDVGAVLNKITKVCKYRDYSIRLGKVEGVLAPPSTELKFVPDGDREVCGKLVPDLCFVEGLRNARTGEVLDPNPEMKLNIAVKDDKVDVTLGEGVTMTEAANEFFNCLNDIMPDWLERAGYVRGESAEGRGDQLIGPGSRKKYEGL